MKQAILPAPNITVAIGIAGLTFPIEQIILEIARILEIVVFVVSSLALLDAIDKESFVVAVLAEMLLAEAVGHVVLPTSLVKVLFGLVFELALTAGFTGFDLALIGNTVGVDESALAVG